MRPLPRHPPPPRAPLIRLPTLRDPRPLHLRCPGTSITVVGAIIPYITGPLPAAEYAIDGQSPATLTLANTSRPLIGVTFYASPALANGTHVLTVNVTTATSNAPYLLDYLAVSNATHHGAASVSSSTSASSSGSSGVSSSATSSSAGASGSPSAAADREADAKGAGKTPTGAVVGGVVGGLALVAALAAAAWWFWRRRRRWTWRGEPLVY